MKKSLVPRPVETAPCWRCGQQNPVLALPGVRLVKCCALACGAIHPAESLAYVEPFFNFHKATCNF